MSRCKYIHLFSDYHLYLFFLIIYLYCFWKLRYVLLAPNLLRVGSSENVFVEAQDYSGEDLNVKIVVKNYPRKNLELVSKWAKLTKDDHFQLLTDIKARATFLIIAIL